MIAVKKKLISTKNTFFHFLFIYIKKKVCKSDLSYSHHWTNASGLSRTEQESSTASEAVQ